MKILIKGIGFLLILLFISGCPKPIIESDSDPNVNLADLKKFYVVKLETDERGIEKVIAKKLNEFGFQATSGKGKTPPEPVDAIVTYVDRWMWDMTMYMLEIRIQLHDPNTDYVFASGQSFRTSLVRKEPEEMIDEVFRDMFAGKIDLPEKKDESMENEEDEL